MVLDECVASGQARRPKPGDRVGHDPACRAPCGCDGAFGALGPARRGSGICSCGTIPHSAPDVIVTNPAQAQFGIIQGGTDPGAPDGKRPADRRDRLRSLRDRRAERRRTGGRHVRRRRAHRAAAARRPAALSDGHRHARRPDRVRRARHRHVRLRAADAERAQRPAPDRAGVRSSSRTPATPRTCRRPIPTAAATPAGTFRAPICATFSSPAR